ncbi:excinuclease ABC subunit C, putative [Babesia ovis]|uniref:Excinuclease ABC subunit C, putative n=1 Tax=Babesia ovis TaxID=5869 RepID=A0A9W5T8Z2_BABOV|nr:excinuclease ABC subunit C, putative [Babesia ovis]
MRLMLVPSPKARGTTDIQVEGLVITKHQRVLKPLLFYIGHSLNTCAFFIYAFALYEISTGFINRFETNNGFHLHFSQRLIIESLLAVCISLLWSKVLSQGFDGDSFSHVLYWRYRLINTREMISRLLGSLTAGALFGLFYTRILPYIYDTTVDHASGSILPAPEGRVDHKTFTELTVMPLTHFCSRKDLGWLYSSNILQKGISLLCSIKLTHARVVLIECFSFEFLFCLLVYLVLSETVVAERFGNCSALYISFKRMACFSANIYLREINEWVSLDAAISTRRFVIGGNLPLYLLRLLANLLAVMIASVLFNPTRRLRQCDFTYIYANLPESIKRSVLRQDVPCAPVDTGILTKTDIHFSRFPNTFLGRYFSRLIRRIHKVKKH